LWWGIACRHSFQFTKANTNPIAIRTMVNWISCSVVNLERNFMWCITTIGTYVEIE